MDKVEAHKARSFLENCHNIDALRKVALQYLDLAVTMTNHKSTPDNYSVQADWGKVSWMFGR